MKRNIVFLALAAALAGQKNSPTLASHIRDQFLHFQASDWLPRSEAFYELTRTGCPACTHSHYAVLDGIENAVDSGAIGRDELAKNLIDLLGTESAFRRSHFSVEHPAPEGYFDYVGDLAMSVVHMRDQRSVNALIGFIDTGGMVGSGIARFGDVALPKVLDVIAKGSAVQVTSAYDVLGFMMEPANLRNFSNPASARMAIKGQLVRGLSESDPFARVTAIRGLAKIGDADVVPLIQKALQDRFAELPGSRCRPACARSNRGSRGDSGRKAVRSSASRMQCHARLSAEPRNSRPGRKIMPFTKSKTPSTAIPTMRNGSRITQTSG